MEITVDFGDQEPLPETASRTPQDPDEFLAQNSFRIVYQFNNFFLPQIRDMIEQKDAINLRPEYQRRLRWTNPQKSKLIESLLLNIPVPPVFFYEADAARYEVMDGQQRLNAIREFFAGDFALRGLTVLTPLNGLRYTTCPPRIKRTLDRATISAIVLLMESESERPHEGMFSITDVRRLVFDRLNTGGRRLNAQEIRNALHPGPLNRCILELSRLERFTEVFGIPPYTEADEAEYYENPARRKNNLYATMRDCELVLRVFALRDPDNIRGSMRSMLDRAMAKSLSSEEVEMFADDFQMHFAFLCDLFGDDPFTIKFREHGKERISAALYDAAMVALSRVWDHREDVRADRVGVAERLRTAVADDENYELIVGRRNTAEAVRGRIDLLQTILLPG
ncbi:DUF262 domain-containing protein [Candidatus Palauibacter sp.]|uniref:DUF262 domain-containing protein n=1 Tax=Candidatus Palauibacter sp. TaxID=3101350 RepID=UPI003D143497